MSKSVYIILFVFNAFHVYSQRFVEPEKMKQFNIIVNYSDYTVKTQILKENKKTSPNADLTYAWYTSQKIIETKGGFDGKLIHGYYRAFYLNDQLKESGEYRFGVKNSLWKSWYPDGKLKEITRWRRGIKTGEFSLYNDDGRIMVKGRFKEGKLHGRLYAFGNDGKISSVQKFKNGRELRGKEKKQKGKISSVNEDSLNVDGVKKENNNSKSRIFKFKDKNTYNPKSNKEDKKSLKKTNKKNIESTPQQKEKKSEGRKKIFAEKIKSLFRKKNKPEDGKYNSKTPSRKQA